MIQRRRVKSTRLHIHSQGLKMPRWRWVVIGSAVGLLLFVFLSGPEGTVRLVKMMWERKRLTQELTDLEKDNQAIQKSIERFRHDPEAVEEEAREKLGFVKKGQVIYRFPKKDK